MLYILLYIIYLSVLENNGETRLAVFHHTPNNQSWARAERWEYDYKLQCGRRKQIMVIILHQHSIFIKMWSFRATKSFLFNTWIGTTKHLTNLDIRNIKTSILSISSTLFLAEACVGEAKNCIKISSEVEIIWNPQNPKDKKFKWKVSGLGLKMMGYIFQSTQKILQIKLPNQIFTTKGASEHQTKCNCCL